MYRDSVGNTYSHLPPKPPNKGAKASKAGPKHRRPHGDEKKKHGIETGRNGPNSRKRFYGEPGPRKDALDRAGK